MPGLGVSWEQKTPPNFMKIHIPDNTQHINLLLSGGADSALLAYLISEQTDRKIYCHTLSTHQENYQHVVLPIMSYLKTIFGERYVFSYIRQQNPLIRPSVEYILSVYPGVVISGCNKVVTHFTPSVYIPGDTPPIRGPALNEHHIRPFIDMDKVEILSLYKEKNLLDLLRMTRSCGLQGLNNCGGCYFCMERNWALSVLDISDINSNKS